MTESEFIAQGGFLGARIGWLIGVIFVYPFVALLYGILTFRLLPVGRPWPTRETISYH